ncbi:MAG: hypothetical protein E7166_00740 [Firmicutes bacterium]|nr:hypothetical protein [Bacillota bacterium]
MKNKYKLLLMSLIGLVSMLIGTNDVFASTLVKNDIPNVYFLRKGSDGKQISDPFHTYTIDGRVVYCIETDVEITTRYYDGTIGWGNSPFSQDINQRIQLIGYYGYDYPSHQTVRYRMATQALIWEAVGSESVTYWTEPKGNGSLINIDYEKNQIMSLVNAHYNRPSFNGIETSAILNEKTAFTDTNGVLSEYEIYKSNNANAYIDGNTLYVTPTSIGDVEVILKKKTYSDDPSIIFMGQDGKSQKMGFFRIDDPIRSAIYIKSYGGTISLEKLDSKTLSFKPLGDASLKGAIYGIYNSNDIKVGTLTTNGQSIVESDYLPSLGRFYLKEETSSLGYKLDDNKYYFEITPNNLYPQVTVYEEVIRRDFELYKVFADANTTILQAEPNVTFNFYLKSNMELYETATTNDKGHLKVRLPYGTYVVRQETTTPNYEKVDDFVITIDNDSKEPITRIISNAEITSKLKLVKVDEDSKKVLVKDGIKFKIRNLDTGEYVTQNITYPYQAKVDIFETKDGVFITPYVLKSGNYQIEELEDQIIDGYIWNSTPLKFSITDTSDFIYDEDFGVMLEVQFSNKQVKGEVEINKYGEKFIIDNGKYYYEEIKLDGVEFELYANGDIYSQDGTLVYKDKELIISFKTEDGYYKLENLYLGKYYLIEKESAINHIIDSTPFYFELKYKDQYTDIVSLQLEFNNRLIKGDFELNKTDISTGEIVPNALIEIYTINDELIFKGYTDENGNIVLKDLPIGKYKFYESEAPNGYILNDAVHYFEIKENGEVVKSTITNQKVIVPKTSIADSKVLNIIGIVSIILGIAYIIYDKKKK